MPAEADLVTYWFEKAREQIGKGKAKRAGLLATQGIRGGANREVLKRIKEAGDIFFAESDRNWIIEGAMVHVSMIGFGETDEAKPVLDGREVEQIHSNLTSAADVTQARRLPGKAQLAFMADTKGGAFDLPAEQALDLLRLPNPHARPNSDVVVPWVNGLDLTRRPRGMFIIDFGTDRSEAEAAKYEAPFQHLVENVRPQRLENRRTVYRERWWVHVEPRPAMRAALAPLERILATATVSKHRLFV